MYLLRKVAYRDILHIILKHTPNKQKAGIKSICTEGRREVMTATNMCSNFGGLRESSPPPPFFKLMLTTRHTCLYHIDIYNIIYRYVYTLYKFWIHIPEKSNSIFHKQCLDATPKIHSLLMGFLGVRNTQTTIDWSSLPFIKCTIHSLLSMPSMTDSSDILMHESTCICETLSENQTCSGDREKLHTWISSESRPSQTSNVAPELCDASGLISSPLPGT